MRPDKVNDLLDTLNYHLANSPLTVIEWDHEFRVKRWSGQVISHATSVEIATTLRTDASSTVSGNAR